MFAENNTWVIIKSFLVNEYSIEEMFVKQFINHDRLFYKSVSEEFKEFKDDYDEEVDGYKAILFQNHHKEAYEDYDDFNQEYHKRYLLLTDLIAEVHFRQIVNIVLNDPR